MPQIHRHRVADPPSERPAGWGKIAEVTGLVALQLLTGAFNLVAGIHARPEELSEITPDDGG